MPDKTVSLTIDGVALTVPEGTLLVEAVKQLQREIPVYCYHPKLGPAGLCRICLVEIEKMPKLQIACNTVATEGMIVHTESGKASEGRRAVLEFLLVNHPLDCPICDKGGECDLQDFSMAYGQGASRFAEAKAKKPKAIDLGPTIVLDDERCIVCQRCTRFDEIITNEQSLVVKDRGQRDVIATASDEPYVSNFSGNVTELCPVGALTSKTYRFKSRPWDLHRTTTTCLQCSVGCQMNVDVRHGEVLRTMSVPDDDAISDGWLCDRGRYNIGWYASEARVTSPLLRDGDEWVQISWDDAIARWAAALSGAAPDAAALIGGGRLLNEEIFLAQYLYRARGTENIDWRTGSQRVAFGGTAGTLLDLERAQAIVTYGRPPSQLAPIMDLRIRKAVTRNGARLISLGDHAAGSHVKSEHARSIAELEHALPAKYDRLAVIWDGGDAALDDAFSQWCIGKRDAGKTVSTFIVSEQSNARGAESYGLLPRGGGLATTAILEKARDGKLASLAILGANPALHFADRSLVLAALAATPFVVVSELFVTETAGLATLILPAKGPFEKSGTTMNVEGRVLAVAPAVEAPAGALSDGEMLVALAAELGVAIPAPHEIAALVRDGVSGARVDAAPARPAMPGRTTQTGVSTLRIVTSAHIFAGGGTSAFDTRTQALRPERAVTVHPATAATAVVRDGDRVDLFAGDRSLLDIVVRIDPAAPEGAALLVAGMPDAPANLFPPDTTVAMMNVRAGSEFAEAVS